jgi:exosortase E/protease (VPEID-CTERM system)
LLPVIPNLQTYPATAVIDAGHFAVQVAPVCSGVEGMGLMLIFCSAWLVLFRREYIFPRALVIVPAGVVLIFVLNAVRIAALVLIGQAGMREMAVYGFHSQAGWIAFNCSAGLVAFASRKSPWLNRAALQETSIETGNPTAAYLMPFLGILAAGMVARALSSGFETLYVLRPIAAGIALCLYWRRLATLDWRMSWRGPLTGIAAFAVWALGAHFLTSPTVMPHGLASMQPAWRESWIAIRLMASVAIVPLGEELAFRGFLMRRMINADFESVSFHSVRTWPLVLSSIAFGLGHGAMWLPAATVGIFYGALLVRTGRMGEAVGAHATTNMLVAVGVLFWNQWQLWS